jgi:tetratricopeptide (TPR) repeat protein
MGHRPQTLILKFVLSAGFVAQTIFFLPGNGFAQRTNDAPVRGHEGDSLERGLEALRDNHLQEALRYLTEAEAGQSTDAKIRNFRGIVLVRLKRNGEAVDEYQKAIRLDPNLEDAYKNLGFLEWTEHHLDSARARLQRAVELDPADSFAHYYLGRVQLDAGLYDRAFDELDRSGITWPADPEFLIETANAYVALRRQDKAREVLNRLSTMRLSDSEVAVVARLLLFTGDNSAAIDLLQRLSERRNPGGPRWAQFDLALSYLMTGKYEEAAVQGRALINRWQVTEKHAAAAWSVVGIAKAHLGDSSAAVSALRQASKFDSRSEEHWLNLTRELMEVNREQAISAAQEALRLNPKSYALNLRLGAAYLSLDRYSESESIFRQLVSAGDPLPTSYVGLAQVLLRTGRAGEAVAELAEAEKKLGPNFLVSYFEGLALERAGRPAEAIPAFQEAIRLSPESAEAYLNLGQAELNVGHNDEAIADLQKCLQFSPANVQAKRLLSQAYRRAGDTEAASRYSQESEGKEAAAKSDLVGDFILPEWQSPPKSARQ